MVHAQIEGTKRGDKNQLRLKINRKKLRIKGEKNADERTNGNEIK